jgi:hypothetical protein
VQGMLTEEVSGTELVRIEQVEEAEASARWQNAAAAGKIPSAREQEAAAAPTDEAHTTEPAEAAAMEQSPATEAEEAAGASVFLRNLPFLTERRAVRRIVLTMESHRMHREVQEAACRALAELTPCVETETEEYRNLEVEGGSALDGLIAEYDVLAAHNVIAGVLQAMSTHAVSSSVVALGCKVLRELARSKANEVKIAKAGGIEAIIAGMRGHKKNAWVQEWACRALRNVGANADNRVKIGEAGGIEAILEGMRCLCATCEAIRQLSVFMLTRRAAALAAMRPALLLREDEETEVLVMVPKLQKGTRRGESISPPCVWACVP